MFYCVPEIVHPYMGNWVYAMKIQKKKENRPSAPKHIHVVKITERDSNQHPPA